MVFTNKGLKLRLSVGLCFAMMAKLYPKVDAFKIFRRTEALERVPPLCRDIVAIVCFYNHVDPVLIIKLMVLAHTIGWIMTAFGLFLIPYLVSLATVYNYIYSYGIILAINWGVAYYFNELDGVMIHIGASIISALFAEVVLGFIFTWFMSKKVGDCVTMSETNFLNACRLYADEYHYRKDFKIPPDFSVTDEELKPSSWSPVFSDYIEKYPEFIVRFRNAEEILKNKIRKENPSWTEEDIYTEFNFLILQNNLRYNNTREAIARNFRLSLGLNPEAVTGD